MDSKSKRKPRSYHNSGVYPCTAAPLARRSYARRYLRFALASRACALPPLCAIPTTGIASNSAAAIISKFNLGFSFSERGCGGKLFCFFLKEKEFSPTNRLPPVYPSFRRYSLRSRLQMRSVKEPGWMVARARFISKMRASRRSRTWRTSASGNMGGLGLPYSGRS